MDTCAADSALITTTYALENAVIGEHFAGFVVVLVAYLGWAVWRLVLQRD